MIQELDEWQETDVIAIETERLAFLRAKLRRLEILRDAFIILEVNARLLICLAAIYFGILISVRSNDGIAVLAALGCGGVIYGLLSPNNGGE